MQSMTHSGGVGGHSIFSIVLYCLYVTAYMQRTYPEMSRILNYRMQGEASHSIMFSDNI